MKSFFVILAILLAIDSVYGLNKQEDCKCKVLSSSRIVGGKTSQQIYPWMVTFFLKPSFKLPGKYLKVYWRLENCSDKYILKAGISNVQNEVIYLYEEITLTQFDFLIL